MILNGDPDLQAAVSDAERLKNANLLAVLSIIFNMNHILKEVHSLEENQKSYSDSNFPLSKELVKQITSICQCQPINPILPIKLQYLFNF